MAGKSNGVPMNIIQWVSGVAIAVITFLCGYTTILILPMSKSVNTLEVKMDVMETSDKHLHSQVHEQTISLERVHNRLDNLEMP